MSGRYVMSVDRTGEFCWDWEECRDVSMQGVPEDVLERKKADESRMQAEALRAFKEKAIKAESEELNDLKAKATKAAEAKDGQAAKDHAQPERT